MLKEKERSLREELEIKKRDEERREREEECEREKEEGRRWSEKLEAVRKVLLEALVLERILGLYLEQVWNTWNYWYEAWPVTCHQRLLIEGY